MHAQAYGRPLRRVDHSGCDGLGLRRLYLDVKAGELAPAVYKVEV